MHVGRSWNKYCFPERDSTDQEACKMLQLHIALYGIAADQAYKSVTFRSV